MDQNYLINYVRDEKKKNNKRDSNSYTRTRDQKDNSFAIQGLLPGRRNTHIGVILVWGTRKG